MTNHTDNYLPADSIARTIIDNPITNPTLITQLIEADTQAQENQPMNMPLNLTPGEQAVLDQINKQNTLTPADDVTALAMALMGGLMPIINRMVETKFAALVANHHTLKQMDENMEQFISDMIEERITSHASEYDHDEFERAVSVIDNSLDDKIERAISDYDFSDQINNAIDAYDFDFSDRISEAIDDYDMSDKINDALEDSEKIVTTDGLAEALRNVTIRLNY